MTRPWPFVALLLAAASARAAGVDTPSGAEAVVRLTEAEAVERARASSARLAQLGALQRAAEEGVRGARSGRLPQLDLSASYARQSDVPELSITSPGPPPSRLTVFPNIPDVWRTRVGAALPLYTGGRVSGAIDSAENQRMAAASDRDGGLNDLALETRVAYWTLVSSRESERVLREAVASFESHLSDARNRQALGMAASNEVLAVQLERDRSELSRLQAANGAAVAEANLRRLVGLPPETRIEPDATAPAPASDEATVALVARAAASRPEVAALRSRIAALLAGARVARAGALPQASLSAGYDYANPNSRILPLTAEWNGTWSVGASVSWSAFDGGRASAAAAQARAQAEAARRQLDDLTQRIGLEVTTRALDLATARAALALAEQASESARENLRVTRDRYREGVQSSSDLLDAETALQRAGLERTLATAQLQVARAGLDRAVGR